MDLLSQLTTALASIMQPASLLFLAAGVVLGLIVGAMPALGGITGLSILLPFALLMDPFLGIVMFVGMMASTNASDTLPAVLFAVPGSSSSQATILDGHPLARKGEAARALGAAYVASMFGGIIGAVILTVALQGIRPFILSFGSAELFMLGLLGISLTGVLSVGAPLKGLIAGGLGLLTASIGIDQLTAADRWTFGSLYLYDGISVVAVALGLFAIPEIIALMVRGQAISEDAAPNVRGSRLRGVIDACRAWFLVIRTSVIGVVVGALPGLGGPVVDWFAYAHAAQTEKGASETFGKGDIRGVIGVDAANNSKEGGALIPTLAFGIPGSTSMALLLSVLIMNGFPVGPRLLTEHADLTLTIVWILVLANVVGTGVLILAIPATARLAQIPFHWLAPFLLVLVVFATYQITRHTGDLLIVLGLSVLGWYMKKYGWPRPPFVLGFVLGPILERFLFNAVTRHGFAWLSRPIVVVVLLLIVATLVGGFFRGRKSSPGPPQVAAARPPLPSEEE